MEYAEIAALIDEDRDWINQQRRIAGQPQLPLIGPPPPEDTDRRYTDMRQMQSRVVHRIYQDRDGGTRLFIE